MKPKRNVRKLLLLSLAEAKDAIAGHFVGYLCDDRDETQRMIATGEIFTGGLPNLTGITAEKLYNILYDESSITDSIFSQNLDCCYLMVEGFNQVIELK